MGWFTKFCREAGLVVHHVIQPVDRPTQKREVSRQVEEKKIGDKMILRRTTIEEIEIRPDEDEKGS